MDAQKNPFEALLQISTELNMVHETNYLLERVMDIAMEALMAERGFILLRMENSDKDFDVVTARRIDHEKITNIRELSSSAVNAVLKSGEAVLTYDALQDERFVGAESIQIQNIHSIACVPLVFNKDIIGAIYIDNRSNVGRFNEESLNFLKAFAQQAAIAIENARIYEKLQDEKDQLRLRMQDLPNFPQIIGKSKKVRELLDLIGNVAQSEATVLIEGESGTGKELVAKGIHALSTRRDKPFIPIFCGSLTETLLESELFGHKKGAFTGATENKVGLLEEANGGTFFLDEIGDVSKNLQTKLLRVLQEGEIKRVGDSKITRIDVRIIAATNKDMWDLVQKNEFRDDLYYRLNVINIKMPSLRERKEDIPLLANHFLRIFADRNKKHLKGFSKEALKALIDYSWNGNIRELENVMERAVIMARGTQIEPTDLQLSRREERIEVGMSLKDMEKHFVLSTLDAYDWNRTKVSEILGVSRRWLQYQLKEWGVLDGDSRL